MTPISATAWPISSRYSGLATKIRSGLKSRTNSGGNDLNPASGQKPPVFPRIEVDCKVGRAKILESIQEGHAFRPGAPEHSSLSLPPESLQPATPPLDPFIESLGKRVHQPGQTMVVGLTRRIGLSLRAALNLKELASVHFLDARHLKPRLLKRPPKRGRAEVRDVFVDQVPDSAVTQGEKHVRDFEENNRPARRSRAPSLRISSSRLRGASRCSRT